MAGRLRASRRDMRQYTAGRPEYQLFTGRLNKRGPLGGERPPHERSFVYSFGTVIARGAERRCARGNLGSPRPATPGAPRGAAPRTAIKAPAAEAPSQDSGSLGLRGPRGALELRWDARRL